MLTNLTGNGRAPVEYVFHFYHTDPSSCACRGCCLETRKYTWQLVQHLGPECSIPAAKVATCPFPKWARASWCWWSIKWVLSFLPWPWIISISMWGAGGTGNTPCNSLQSVMQLHCAGNCSTGAYYVQAKCTIIAQWENNCRKRHASMRCWNASYLV